ncbi:MAG TPA: shikimate dehydrogenase [Polyangiales bacterium]|nr:shikimate dehydrogenase [Polyangiales bacterium]
MTAIYGVLGWPVAHSRSPAMHNAAFAALGLDALYVPLAVPPARLPAAIAALRTLDVAGANATLPHKSALIALLDQVEPAALAIGAVNTIVRDGARLLGANTDAEGLARSLQYAGVGLAGMRALVLGTGGAARAAVVGLAGAGVERIAIAGRRRDQAQQLALELGAHCAPCALDACDLAALPPALLAACDLLVQATSATLGDGADAQAFAASIALAELPAHAVVCDLVYKPLHTALMRAASARGLRTVDGLGMLLHQGALAFERWTGQPAPLEIMRRAL